MAKCFRKVLRIGFLLAFGVGLIVFGKLSPDFLNERLNDFLKEKFALRPGSEAYFDWLSTQRSADVKFYVFNVTNTDDVITYGAKPKVKELGPYKYELKRSRTDLKFNDEERQRELSFTQSETYTGSIDNSWQSHYGRDRPLNSVVTVNIPILTLATWLRLQYDTSQSSAVAELLKNLREHLFTTVSVEDLLWGYESQGLVQTNNMLKERFGISLFNDTTFGLLYQKGEPRMTKRDSYSIKTGIDDLPNLKKMMMWNSQVPQKTDQWSYGAVTDGTGFDPTVRSYYDWMSYLDGHQVLSPFIADWCRVNDYSYNYETYWGDFTSSRYILSKTSIEDVAVYKNNYPIFLSQPHFYSAHHQYVDAVVGLDPANYKHETAMNVEKYTSQVLTYTRRIQYNVEIKQLSAFAETEKLPYEGLMFPVAWKEETYDPPSDVLSTVYANGREVKIMKKIAIWLPFGTVVLGSVIIGCLGLVLIINTTRRLRTCIRERRAKRYERCPLIEHLQQKPENITEIRKGYTVLE